MTVSNSSPQAGQTSDPKAVPKPVKPPRLITLILMTATTVISLNMIVPALGSMSVEFEVSYSTISFLFSGYLLIIGGLTLLYGPLSDRFGRRIIGLTAMSTFILASLGCALAPTYELLLAARILQGLVVGCSVLSYAVVRDTSVSQKETTQKLALIAMAMAVAPLIGPLIGGIIADVLGWRAVFLFQAMAASLTLTLMIFDLRETNLSRSATFIAQFRAYPTLITSLRFWGNVLTLALGVAVFFAFLAGLPLIGVAQFELSQTMIGLFLGTLTLGYITANGITRMLIDRLWLSTLMAIGRAIGILGAAVSLILILSGVTNPYVVFLPLSLLGAANGLSLQPANAGVVSVNPRLAGSAAGLSGALTSWLGAAVSALIGFWLTALPSLELFVLLLLVFASLSLLPALLVVALDRQDTAKGHPPS